VRQDGTPPQLRHGAPRATVFVEQTVIDWLHRSMPRIAGISSLSSLEPLQLRALAFFVLCVCREVGRSLQHVSVDRQHVSDERA